MVIPSKCRDSDCSPSSITVLTSSSPLGPTQESYYFCIIRKTRWGVGSQRILEIASFKIRWLPTPQREPTYFGNCFFWVQDPQQITQLRSSAEQAVALRRHWEEAANTSDPRRRAEALWPFLSIKDYGPSFLAHTKLALQNIAPVSGDYFAEQFANMARSDRADLFKDAGVYGGEKLHGTLTNYIRMQQQLYETFASNSGLDGQDVLTRWNTLPEYVKDIYGDIYYGLAGLASFQRRDDLPL